MLVKYEAAIAETDQQHRDAIARARRELEQDFITKIEQGMAGYRGILTLGYVDRVQYFIKDGKLYMHPAYDEDIEITPRQIPVDKYDIDKLKYAAARIERFL